MILHSLRVRLVLMFMLVVMVAVGTVAIVAGQATANNLQIYMQSKNVQQINVALLTAYQQHESQQALQALIEQLARSLHDRIILLDNHERVIADSDRTLIGRTITPATAPASVSGTTSPTIFQVYPPSLSPSGFGGFTVSDSASQELSPAAIEGSPETAFLTAVSHSLWLAVLVAGLTALLLALLFANTLLKPLHTLKVVAHRLEEGDLSQRVAIKGKGEIGALAHAFNAMADSLSRAERLRRNLVSDVAHELRNPLMNIRGTLELLQDQVLEPTPETIASLYEETALLSRLIADLQDLSLAEAGQIHLARRSISLEEVVSHATQMVQPVLAKKNLVLRVKIPADLPQLDADPERVAQILRNLLSNAIRHTPSQREISITAALNDSDSMVAVSVRDTGEGIAPEHLPYLFERFYRADSSRARATGGTGLGLAIVKQMVEAHGGRVTVESQPGEGACFTFTLPIADDAASPVSSVSSVSS